MTCNSPKLDFVNINAYIKFGENISVSSQDIEQKQNFDITQGAITLVQMCEKCRVTIPG